MATDEGATPRELLLEACRRDNTSLLAEVFSTLKPSTSSQSHEQAVADLINNSRDPLGNAALHVAASAGSYDTLDTLLDQSLVETDPLCRRDAETPLHKAVHFTNTLSSGDWAAGQAVVEMLVDAGCDPRIRNKGGMKAVDLVDPRNESLRDWLRRAEMAAGAGGDVVDEDEDDGPVEGDVPSDSD